MESRREDGPDERERLARLLAWRQAKKKVPEAPVRRWLSFVGSAAWLGFGVLMVAVVAQRSERSPVAATVRPASAEITSPTAPVAPATLTAERAAPAGAARVSANEAAYARPEQPARAPSIGRKAPSAPGSARRPGVSRRGTSAPSVAAASRLTAAVTTARRWVGYVPKANEAIVRWVKSQPRADSWRLSDPERPQAR